MGEPGNKRYGFAVRYDRQRKRFSRIIAQRPAIEPPAEHRRSENITKLTSETTAMAEDLLKSTTACLKADLPTLAPLTIERWNRFLTDAIKEELRIRGEE